MITENWIESFNSLSSNQKQISILLANGLNNVQIAKIMNRAHGTIKNQMSIIYEVMGVDTRLQYVLLLFEAYREKKLHIPIGNKSYSCKES